MWVIAWSIAGWYAGASAQTFYKWTDGTGVVHFSDLPPSNTMGVEERHLASQPAAQSKTDSAAPSDNTTAEPGNTAPKVAAAPVEGPARVILVSRQAPRSGPSAMHVIGEVKNVGGADARRVAVTLVSVDSTQGTPCLQQEAAVTPSTLHPGESGNFDVDVDSPCLYGQSELDVAPLWE